MLPRKQFNLKVSVPRSTRSSSYNPTCNKMFYRASYLDPRNRKRKRKPTAEGRRRRPTAVPHISHVERLRVPNNRKEAEG